MIVSLLLAALVLLGLYVGSHRLSGLQVAGVVTTGVVGLVLVIVPRLASYAAGLLGVGRGTDLLLYLSIVGGLFVSANFYFRAKRQERQIVVLTRELSLQHPKSGG
jgi:hypothetical protein